MTNLFMKILKTVAFKLIPSNIKFYLLRAVDYRMTALEAEIRLGKATSLGNKDMEIYNEIHQLLTHKNAKRWRQ